MKKLLLLLLLSLSFVGSVNASCTQDFNIEDLYSLDNKIALGKLVPLAEQGNVDASYTIGLIYKTGGKGVLKDFEQTVNWFTKAAEQGSILALRQLGYVYYHGVNLNDNINHSKAFTYFKLAADKGDVDSQTMVAAMYLRGHGVAKDIEQGINWYTKVADQGHSWVTDWIGRIYKDDSMGVPQDSEKAFFWFTKAAEQGNKRAQLELSLISYEEYIMATDRGCPQGCKTGYVEIGGECIEKFW